MPSMFVFDGVDQTPIILIVFALAVISALVGGLVTAIEGINSRDSRRRRRGKRPE